MTDETLIATIRAEIARQIEPLLRAIGALGKRVDSNSRHISQLGADARAEAAETRRLDNTSEEAMVLAEGAVVTAETTASGLHAVAERLEAVEDRMASVDLKSAEALRVAKGARAAGRVAAVAAVLGGSGGGLMWLETKAAQLGGLLAAIWQLIAARMGH